MKKPLPGLPKLAFQDEKYQHILRLSAMRGVRDTQQDVHMVRAGVLQEFQVTSRIRKEVTSRLTTMYFKSRSILQCAMHMSVISPGTRRRGPDLGGVAGRTPISWALVRR